MFLINPKLTNNNQNSDALNSLLESIDSKILTVANKQYYNQVYGFTDYIDYDLYDTLCEYREILLDKLLGCNCLVDGPCNETYLIFIMSKIQKLVNNFS